MPLPRNVAYYTARTLFVAAGGAFSLYKRTTAHSTDSTLRCNAPPPRSHPQHHGSSRRHLRPFFTWTPLPPQHRLLSRYSAQRLPYRLTRIFISCRAEEEDITRARFAANSPHSRATGGEEDASLYVGGLTFTAAVYYHAV